MSRLYYFNIVHDDIDKGLKTKSPQWVQKTWDEIEEDLAKIRNIRKMYNDSIIVDCPEVPKPELFAPHEVAKALADDGFPEGNNKRILLKLADMGASLVPCEDVTYYRLHHKIRNMCNSGQVPPHLINAPQESLTKRDKFIGKVIFKTLHPEEVGVLFLGREHNRKGKMVKLLEGLSLEVEERNPHIRDT